jgi:hypothetical protein
MGFIRKPFWVFFLVVLAQGCAAFDTKYMHDILPRVPGTISDTKYNFSEIRAEMQVTSDGQSIIAVATLDQRDDILARNCSPMYVGMQRALFGNPWRVNTESGLPFAQDITKVVSESMANKGFRVIPIVVSHNKSEKEALQVLIDEKTYRSILIIIRKWESDTYTNIGLVYDLRLIVIGDNQSVLAETSAAEVKNIQLTFNWETAAAAAKKQLPIVFKQVIEKLFNDPPIVVELK